MKLKEYVTENEIIKARQMDLFSFLQTYEPDELVKCERDEYCTKTHDSLKISNGKWFWFSRGIGGASALDYLVKVRNMDFVSAVKSLNGSVFIPPVRPVQKQPAKKKYDHLYLPPFNLYCQNVRPYLLARGIDKEIINLFIDRRLLAEDCKTGAALFFGRDEAGRIMQCSLRATDGTPRKKDLAGSNRKYAFGLFGEGRTTVRVFEAAIDLMSYLTLQKRCGQDYLNTNAISLSGVFLPNEENLAESKIPESLNHYLQQYPTEKILLHLDSDDAGRRFAAAMCAVLEKEYDISYHPPPAGKDFNEYLQMRMKWKKERENEVREH